MRAERLIPALRAWLARVLVEEYGFSRRGAAEALEISPAAVTHYLDGKRGKVPAELKRPEVERLLGELAAKAAARGGRISEAELYDLALTVASVLEESGGVRPEEVEEKGRQTLLRILRERAQAEHEAAEEFMKAAVKLRSELTRMLFRQIASDSIKHADILTATISMLERGGDIRIDLPSRDELKSLLEKEEVAHIHSLDDVKQFLPHKLVKVLMESVEADERKHARILRSLMELAEK